MIYLEHFTSEEQSGNPQANMPFWNGQRAASMLGMPTALYSFSKELSDAHGEEN
jgi:hypothetical protein